MNVSLIINKIISILILSSWRSGVVCTISEDLGFCWGHIPAATTCGKLRAAEFLSPGDSNDMTHFSADTQRALEAVERLQAKLKERGTTSTQEKLSLLKIVLQSPLFYHILSLQQAQRKPLAKVEHEHGCVGVGCIVNTRKGPGIMSKKTECWNQPGWVISLPKLITKASRKREIGSEQERGGGMGEVA